MNKKFSLENIISGIKRTIERFPVVIIINIVATILSLILIHNEKLDIISRLFFTLFLAFPLSITATIFIEQNKGKKTKIITSSVIGLFLLIYLMFLSNNLLSNITRSFEYIQYILWLIGSFILMTFVPFIKKTSSDFLDFWYYNQRIFYAFIGTFIYSAAIYIGLSIALMSINFLFDLGVDNIRFVELWIVIVGIFSTTFFLSRYPKIQVSESNTIYPKELKIFTHYVLTPLVCIYFMILYTYTVKILLTWEWPKGVVSSMVLGFSALGIITYSLLYPLIIKENNLRRISRIFFGILLPQVFVLFWAVWLRISDYGITENRYLLVVLGLWLMFISLYFLISKVRNIRLIVISLFVVLIGISFGPWGMSSVSKFSQINRLENILQKDRILIDGKINKTYKEISFEDRKQISGIINYLYENHGFSSIQPWFGQGLDMNGYKCKNDTENICFDPEQVTALLGIVYVNEYQKEEHFTFTADKSKYYNNIRISGYDYLINDSSNVEIDGNKYDFKFDTKTLNYYVYKNGHIISTVSVKELIDKLNDENKKTGRNNFSSEEMSIIHEDENLKMKIYISSTYGFKDSVSVEETILVSFK